VLPSRRNFADGSELNGASIDNQVAFGIGCASYVHFRSAGYHRGITSGIHTAMLLFFGVQVAPKCKHLD